MMGRRSPQGSLFGAREHYLDFVGRKSFYGFLAQHGQELFQDDQFAGFYCATNGRPSVPPSLMAVALLLKAHDGVSDAEATRRAAMDLGWKVALGVDVDARPFAKSTLWEFRAQLVIHEEGQGIFDGVLSYAKAKGYLSGALRVALDTTMVFGRGAVEDTYNLIGHGIRDLCRVLSSLSDEKAEAWSEARGLGRYFASSLKKAAGIDWDDASAREAFLTEIIGDGQRVLELGREARCGLERGSAADRRVVEAADLLVRLLWQDVEPTDEGYRIKKGTAKDRVPSADDSEQRHGRKSQGKTFTGHKAAVAVEADTGVITAVDVVAGNESDGESAATLVEATEGNTGCEVEQVIGDTAYGGMETRKALGDREVIAPTVKPGGRGSIPKSEFEIDVAEGRVRCPEGHETRDWTWKSEKVGADKTEVQVKCFAFPKQVCQACPRRAECYTEKRRGGRLITFHPDEERLQAARALEQTDYFREQYDDRVVVEHRIARLVQLGIRQARYVGRKKTRFQLVMAAAVANLTLLAGKEASESAFCRVFAPLRGLWRWVRSLTALSARWRPTPTRVAA